MKKIHIFVTVFFFIAAVYFIVKPLIPARKLVVSNSASAVTKLDMKLTSPAFDNYQKIPVDYTCSGKKIAPPFSIEGVPLNAKSLVIIVDDPDAPTGTFTHWIIWNIDPLTKEVRAGATPDMSQEGTTSAGKQGYVPPCPPTGQHRYFFTLYALDTKLGLDGKARKMDIEAAMAGHIMAQFLLIGIYR